MRRKALSAQYPCFRNPHRPSPKRTNRNPRKQLEYGLRLPDKASPYLDLDWFPISLVITWWCSRSEILLQFSWWPNQKLIAGTIDFSRRVWTSFLCLEKQSFVFDGRFHTGMDHLSGFVLIHGMFAKRIMFQTGPSNCPGFRKIMFPFTKCKITKQHPSTTIASF